MRGSNPRWPIRLAFVAALSASAAGCHHVIIDGGLEPTETRYDEEWNLAFAAAIFPAKVAPPTGCEGYFSEVETRHSFLNLVVTWFTFGIISPMESRIQCGAPAGGGTDHPDLDMTAGDTGSAPDSGLPSVEADQTGGGDDVQR